MSHQEGNEGYNFNPLRYKGKALTSQIENKKILPNKKINFVFSKLIHPDVESYGYFSSALGYLGKRHMLHPL